MKLKLLLTILCVIIPAMHGQQSRQPWREIQQQVNDTVVQILCQVVEFNFFKPYEPAEVYSTRGSGFFIDGDAHVVTNAHVIDQARKIFLRVPSLGKHLFEVERVGVCPERDLALLKVVDQQLPFLKEVLGEIPYLTLGDSDSIYRADEVLALGYPLGQESLKSTAGMISVREEQYIQMSAPINPGSSGGPLLNIDGLVIGINSRGQKDAQNTGYIIPINELKIILQDLKDKPLVRKPFLGVTSMYATSDLTAYLGNPEPGGCFVIDVIEGSPLAKAGIQSRDMIYQIDGHDVDIYGDLSVSWSEDKISLPDYVAQLSIGQKVDLVVYRHGEKLEIDVTFGHTEELSVRVVHPDFEPLDYEIIGGMIVMPLTLNHLQKFQSIGLARFAQMQNQVEPALIISYILPTSYLFQSRTISRGSILTHINEIPVKTLDDFRRAVLASFDTNFLAVSVMNTAHPTCETLFTALRFDKVVSEITEHAQLFNYQLTPFMKEVVQRWHM